ncbi:hypothetical protein POM88_035947 [Heracleum sosnowskyi]|uniref:U5 small nuclear ribonucleoprotein TSSC4 n=1 Tax=Heracleum sosnowskyi TaxID=360622 RepID=A0AAD8MBZ8_9APIA|nr:hypothetical protein POM88_035947 [Heracleum sosnowskyi]
MEDSFNVRVNKVFGSLPTPAAASSSLWCLTDEEIEKREWNRDKGSPVNDDEPKPYPENLDAFAKIKTDDLLQELEEELEDEEEEIDKGGLVEREGYSADDWDVRVSIGKDSTLDYEEEEDQFDQVAIGREDALGILYQRDITDYETDIKSYSELPNTFKLVNKDPRANRRAAKIRLQEDAAGGGAANVDYMPACTTPHPAQNGISKESVGLNSILKSKGNQVDTKSKKRVRFESSCKDECDKNSEGSNVLASETSLELDNPDSIPKDSPNVPDYLINPSKYKHYTFDPSPDTDEASNHRAYADFLKLVKQPDQMESQDSVPFELPKSVTFTPKKKPGENTVGINRNQSEQNQNKRLPIAMAAEDELGNGICAMEEDEHEEATDDTMKSSQKSGRRYRTKDSE